ncbi:MAG: glutaredoxin [Coxiellaceae bacterium]|nr:glutaredoxin [Coxiellaceae bacterium]
MSVKTTITIYKWAGKFGPFRIKIPCGECTLTTDIVNATVYHELGDIPIEVIEKNWLDHWYKPLLRGGWHAPMVLVDNKVISQGVALNRGVLVEAVIAAHSSKTPITGNHMFGKDNCSFCREAKTLLNQHNIDYEYHEVIEQPKALYEMLTRVKPIIHPKTPITTPQIWLNGQYIGGYDALKKHLTD